MKTPANVPPLENNQFILVHHLKAWESYNPRLHQATFLKPFKGIPSRRASWYFPCHRRYEPALRYLLK